VFTGQFVISSGRMSYEMKLFFYEVRKILSWKLLLLILLVNVLLFKLLIEFDLKYFPNGRPAGDHFDIEQQIIPLFGAEWDETELLELQAMYEKEMSDADAYLAKDPEAVALSMDSYEKFKNYDYVNEQQEAYHNKIVFDSDEDFPWRLQTYDWYLTQRQYREDAIIAYMNYASEGQKKRLQQLLDEERFAVYSEVVPSNFKTYKTSIAIAIFVSIAILISPIFIRDKIANVVPLQYSSAKGRKLYRTKWLAGLFSGTLLTAILLLFYMALYGTNDTKSHFDLPLTSFSWNYYWYDITFWQYIILSVTVIFALSVVLTILIMAISSVVPNRIVLIGVQIVVLFVMIAVGTTYVVRNVIDLNYAQLFVPSLVGGFTLFTGLFMWAVWKRELKRDIV
jgi:hypothetical protein